MLLPSHHSLNDTRLKVTFLQLQQYYGQNSAFALYEYVNLKQGIDEAI
uniref:Uncharacterized protein n=1 Tax=Raoultella planticola TaxID=575 RepID=W8CTR2_RAOPL|nr:hypothetical protein pKpNDM1_00353 [Raoultella planticola]